MQQAAMDFEIHHDGGADVATTALIAHDAAPPTPATTACHQFLDNSEHLRLLVSVSPAACIGLMQTAKVPRAAALSELRDRLSSSSSSASANHEELVHWLLREMRGEPVDGSAEGYDPLQAIHSAYVAARLPVYGLIEVGKKRYESHTEWSVIKPRLLDALDRLVQLPSLIFNAAVFSAAAPSPETPDSPMALTPAAALKAMGSIDAIRLTLAETLAARIDVAETLNATIDSLPFAEGLRGRARKSVERSARKLRVRRVAALREAFRQHGSGRSAELTAAQLSALTEEGLRAASASPSPAAARVLVLEAAVAALGDVGRAFWAAFLKESKRKEREAKKAGGSATATMAAASAVDAAAEAVDTSGDSSGELVEEEPLLRMILAEGGIERSIQRSELELKLKEANAALAAAKAEEERIRTSNATSSNLERRMVAGKKLDLQPAEKATEAAKQVVGELEAQAAVSASAGVMTYEETARRARAFLRAPDGAGAYRALYELAVEWRQRLDEAEEALEQQQRVVNSKSASSRAPPPAAARRTNDRLRLLLAAASAAASAADPRMQNTRATCGHACTAACGVRVMGTPLPRFLMAQLRNLMMNCGDAGVSAFPAPIERPPLAKRARVQHFTSKPEEEEDDEEEAAASGGGGDAEGLLMWQCTVEGPADTPWEGRRVRCTLNFCPEAAGGSYPDKPPQLRVLPPIPYHPNIDHSSGAVCMDLLQREWSAGIGILGLLISFRSLLSSPTQGDASSMPANVLAARLLMDSPSEYRRANQKIAEKMECT